MPPYIKPKSRIRPVRWQSVGFLGFGLVLSFRVGLRTFEFLPCSKYSGTSVRPFTALRASKLFMPESTAPSIATDLRNTVRHFTHQNS